MWFANLLEQDSAAGAAVAPVSFAQGQQFGAVGDSEHRSIPVFGPGGSGYVPRQGERLLLLRCDGGEVCAGVAGDVSGLLPGELRLGHADGGYIHLRQDGAVVINGLTITRDGRIFEKQTQ